MALCDYYSGFDFARIGTMTFTLTTSVGPFSDSLTLSSGMYAHIDFTPSGSLYDDLAGYMHAYFNGLGGGRPAYTISFNQTTMQYSFDTGTGNLLLSFTGAAGDIAKQVLGYSADFGPTSSAILSDVRPYYAIRSMSQGISAYSDEYEPEDGTEDAEADDGTPYSIARSTLPVYVDWEQRLEEKTAPATAVAGGTATPGAGVFTYSTSAAQPFSWQHMVRHIRGSDAFALYDASSGDGMVCKMRKETAAFHPERAMSDYDVLWNLPFKTRLLGRL